MNDQKRQKYIQTGVIIASSIIWATVIVACSWILKDHYESVSSILIIGATLHVVMLSSVHISKPGRPMK